MKLRFLFLVIAGALFSTSLIEAKSPKKQENVVIVDIDAAPEFVGGDDAMFAWIDSNIRYPESMAKKRKRGVVVVDFLVNADGSLSDIQITKKLNPDADSEALRLVHMMPNWTPGMYQGHAVAVPFSLPIGFNPPPVENDEPSSLATWLKKKIEDKQHPQKEATPQSTQPEQPAKPDYFVNGQLFTGDINALSVTDIESITEHPASPEHPNGRIDIKLKKK